MDSSAVKLAELSALYSPTAEEIQISTLVWAAMIEAAETGQMRPSLGEAGVYDAMFAIAVKYPDIAENSTACGDDSGVVGRAGEMYPCARTCQEHANDKLAAALPRALLELTVAKWTWVGTLAEDLVVLDKARGVLAAFDLALSTQGNLQKALPTIQGDLDALTDLIVATVLERAGQAAKSLSTASWLLVATVAWTVFTLYRDYKAALAECMKEQAMACIEPAPDGWPGCAAAVKREKECIPASTWTVERCIEQSEADAKPHGPACEAAIDAQWLCISTLTCEEWLSSQVDACAEASSAVGAACQ